jgi:hypothetical protein
MQDSNLTGNDQVYQQALDSVQKEIDDMEAAEIAASQVGKGLGDYDLSAASAKVRQARVAAEKMKQQELRNQQISEFVPPEKQIPLRQPGRVDVTQGDTTLPEKESFERFKSQAPEENFPSPGKQKPLEKPMTEPAQEKRSYDVPEHLRGSYAGTENQSQTPQRDELGNVYKDKLLRIPRQLNGQTIYLLKDDDSLKAKDWVQTTKVDGKTYYYTTDPNVPGAVYKRDIFREYPSSDREPEYILSDEKLGTVQLGDVERKDL